MKLSPTRKHRLCPPGNSNSVRYRVFPVPHCHKQLVSHKSTIEYSLRPIRHTSSTLCSHKTLAVSHNSSASNLCANQRLQHPTCAPTGQQPLICVQFVTVIFSLTETHVGALLGSALRRSFCSQLRGQCTNACSRRFNATWQTAAQRSVVLQNSSGHSVVP